MEYDTFTDLVTYTFEEIPYMFPKVQINFTASVDFMKVDARECYIWEVDNKGNYMRSKTVSDDECGSRQEYYKKGKIKY